MERKGEWYHCDICGFNMFGTPGDPPICVDCDTDNEYYYPEGEGWEIFTEADWEDQPVLKS